MFETVSTLPEREFSTYTEKTEFSGSLSVRRGSRPRLAGIRKFFRQGRDGLVTEASAKNCDIEVGGVHVLNRIVASDATS